MSARSSLLSGRPRFRDTKIAAMASQQGDEAAWRTAWKDLGPASAALQAGGDFAVVLRDGDRVFMAIDRFAIRSLCYRVVGNELRVAERADALGSTSLDPQAIFDYLYSHAIPSPRTVFSDVMRLPPGHYGLFEQGRLTVAPYWIPDFRPVARPDFAALRDEFRSLLAQAVRRQLDGSTPACFLSGGTDSSTVAGMICQEAGQAAHSYSIGFEAQGYDEMAFARTAARHFGTQHHEYYVTPADLVREVPHVAAAYDQPFGNSSALPAFRCAQVARADGVTRMLAGDGGDELFGGNTRYAKQRIFAVYDQVPAALRSGLLEPLFERTPLGTLPLLKKGRSYIEQAKVPMPMRMYGYNLLLRLGIDEVLEPDFAARVDRDGPVRQQREVWALARAEAELDRTLAYDWRYTLAENDLPKVCGTTALAGVAVGFPLLDEDLVDFSLKLPLSYKLNGLKLRWFFKEALRGFLPQEIITKKKQGFGLPFGVWLCQDAGLQKLAFDSLASLSTRKIVRPAFIHNLRHTLLPQHPGYYGEMVWILMMLEQWLRRQPPPMPQEVNLEK